MGGFWFFGGRVLQVIKESVEVDEAAVTVTYGDGRDDSLIDKALDQPGVDGGVRVELVDLGDCLGDISHSYGFHYEYLFLYSSTVLIKWIGIYNNI